MRVVFTSHTAYLQGGAQHCLLDLVKGIRKYYPNYEIYIIFPEVENLIELFIPYINDYTVIKQPYWMVKPEKKSFRKGISRLIKIGKYTWKTLLYLRSISPTIVITNTIASPTTAIACKLGGYKHLWMIHEIPQVSKNYEFLYPESCIIRTIDILSSKVLAISNSISQYYGQLIRHKNKICRIHYSVEIERNTIFQKKEEIYTLLLAGNFDLNKGQIEAIHACKKIFNESKKEFRLLLVGAVNDEYSNYVRDIVSKENLASFIKIIDFTPDISTYYLQADVLLMCSASEGLPRVVIEAQKYGIPVIATSIEANKELVVEGYNGLFYNRGDISGLVHAILTLSDKKIREQMSKQAISFMSGRYTLQRFVIEFKQLC